MGETRISLADLARAKRDLLATHGRATPKLWDARLRELGVEPTVLVFRGSSAPDDEYTPGLPYYRGDVYDTVRYGSVERFRRSTLKFLDVVFAADCEYIVAMNAYQSGSPDSLAHQVVVLVPTEYIQGIEMLTYYWHVACRDERKASCADTL